MKCASSVCPLEADDDKVLEGWRCQKMEGASPCVTVWRRATPPPPEYKGAPIYAFLALGVGVQLL